MNQDFNEAQRLTQGALDPMKQIIAELARNRDVHSRAFLLQDTKREYGKSATNDQKAVCVQSANTILQADPKMMGASNALQMKSEADKYLKGKGKGNAETLVKKSDELVSKQAKSQKEAHSIRPKLR